MRVPATAWMAAGLILLAPQWAAAQLGFSSTPKNAITSSSTLKSTSGSTLFGNSKTSTPSSAASAKGTSSEAVTPMLGQEWHIERTHERGSFVGADSRDKMGFIGRGQAMETGTLASAVAGLRLLMGNVNVPLPLRRNTEIYEPHVALGFEVSAPAPQSLGVALGEKIQANPAFRLTLPIAVSLEGTTATLRGEVASERERALIEQRVLFEPGIYSVRNQLTVKAPSPTEKP